MMKKLLPVVVLILCLFVFACKKDKSKKTSTDVSIVGKWAETSAIISQYDKDGKLVNSQDYTASGGPITFNADGTAVTTQPDGSFQNLTYTINTVDGKKVITIVHLQNGAATFTENYDLITLTDHDLEIQLTTINSSSNSGYAKSIGNWKYTR